MSSLTPTPTICGVPLGDLFAYGPHPDLDTPLDETITVYGTLPGGDRTGPVTARTLREYATLQSRVAALTIREAYERDGQPISEDAQTVLLALLEPPSPSSGLDFDEDPGDAEPWVPRPGSGA